MQKSFSICLPQKISLPLPGNFYDCALFKQYTLENEEIVIFLDNPAPSLPIIRTKGGMGKVEGKVAKHPPGYLLSLSCLSSHLLMRWQTTPAATVTR
jgi:hypothetical protein